MKGTYNISNVSKGCPTNVWFGFGFGLTITLFPMIFSYQLLGVDAKTKNTCAYGNIVLRTSSIEKDWLTTTCCIPICSLMDNACGTLFVTTAKSWIKCIPPVRCIHRLPQQQVLHQKKNASDRQVRQLVVFTPFSYKQLAEATYRDCRMGGRHTAFG